MGLKGMERTMLDGVVLPKIEEVKTLLQKGKLEDAKKIIEQDILGLIIPYRQMELETYENIPENLKSAPNSVRNKEIIDTFEEVIQLLFDENTTRLYYVTEQDLYYVASKIREILQALGLL